MSREAHTAALPRGWARHLVPLAAVMLATAPFAILWRI